MWLGNEKSNVCTVSLCSARSYSKCSVTERIPFVNNFGAVSRKGVLKFVWIFILLDH